MSPPRPLRRAPLLALLPAGLALAAGSCTSDYSYVASIGDRVDIHDVVECRFDETADGWEQYTCVPVFSSADEAAGDWESGGIGDFDIVQREVFGAPFYQLWYTGVGGAGASDIGYAVSMDGVEWRRHWLNPILRRGTGEGEFDRDDANVGCAAFDGDAGAFHLWYTGTNSDRGGTEFGHATSPDGVIWTKDPFNPLDPLRGAQDLPISRVWGCDAFYEDGGFHFWIGGVTNDGGGIFDPSRAAYDIGYLRTANGAEFEVSEDLVLTHQEIGGEQFDAEGVHKPSVFTYDEGDGGDAEKYWMIYAGYNDVIATQGGGLITYTTRGRRLGMARSATPSSGWSRVSEDPVPLDFSDAASPEVADNPRAFFINGRLHVFFTDRFTDELGDEVSGIGLGISPFPGDGGSP